MDKPKFCSSDSVGRAHVSAQKPNPGSIESCQSSLYCQYRAVSAVIQGSWARSPAHCFYYKSFWNSPICTENLYQCICV